ncbi:MAG: hypothetical protein DWQ01_05955 [Planctomycetota bacterium]|nr:MAG: hypothetical protein DWQ01_05955 [Planctomycetota bacterium]
MLSWSSPPIGWFLWLLFVPGLGAQEPAPVANSQEEGQDQVQEKEAEVTVDVLVIGRHDHDPIPVVPLESIGSRTVLGPEKVRETGSRDLNDLVQHLPAASTRPYNGGEASAPSFSMRGLPDDGLTEYIHVLVDGVPASPLPFGWTAFSFLPLTTERVYAIDYVRGGHTLRYSPNTVGGVLNFLTQPIPENPRFETRTTFGSFDYASTLLSAGGTVDGVGLLATYVDRRGEGYRRNGGFDQQDLNLKFRMNTGDGDGRDWVAVSATYMEDEHQAPGGLTRRQFRRNRFGNSRPDNRFDGYRGLLDAVYHQESAGGWMEWFGHFSETARHLRAQRPHFGTPTTISDWDDESYFAALGVRFEESLEFMGTEHTLYGGARIHRDWIPSWKLRSLPLAGGSATTTQDAAYHLTSLSVHLDDTFEPVENLQVNFGLRGEWIPQTRGRDPVGGWEFENDDFILLPGAGLSYLWTDHLAWFANYYQGFRAPQVWGYAFTTGSGQLEFEKGRTMESGLRWQGEAGTAASVTAWRTEYDDFGVFYSGFYENLGRIVANGADLLLDWELGETWAALEGFYLGASFTLQDSELKTGPNRGNETPYAWEKKAAWRFGYQHPDGWAASLGGTYVGESFSDEANTAQTNANGNLGVNPAWVLWDLRLARWFSLEENAELELAVGATNLFDKDWYVHSRGGFFGGGMVAGPPRQAYASLNLILYW